MAKPLSILFVSSEVFPFAKVSGLGDISYSLPLAIRDIGHDIRVMLPKYGNISERKNRIHEINRLRDMPIAVGDNTAPATVKSSSINNPRVKVQAYITTNQCYFDDKKGVYTDPATGREFADNDERFIFFNKTVIDTCLLLGWFPDIIHCNDWQTALIPVYARGLYPNKFRKTKFITTIHDFGRQGVFPESTFAKTGLPKELKNSVTQGGNFNFLKGGLLYSDYITTDSQTYAEELLQDSKYGNGLNSILIEKADRFAGTSCGVDNWMWNPETDINLPVKFSDDFEEFKRENKEKLLAQFDQQYEEGVPVLSYLGKLEEDRGISLLLESADKLLKENIKIIIFGEGEPEIKAKIQKLEKKYPDKLLVKFSTDEVLTHLIPAGSDIFLAPALHEPRALYTLYSLAYGTIPVARATGALIDIVSDYDKDKEEGNGFMFTNFANDEFIKAVKKALALYKNKEEWQVLGMKAMNGNYSWEPAARKYDEIYRGLMKE